MGANEHPPYPHFGSPTSQGMSAESLLSRRQYLSRMDRFQHGCSARTVGLESAEIN